MKILTTLAFLTLALATAHAQSHGHINAGAIDSNNSGQINSGDRLFMYFESGTETTTLAYNSGATISGADGYLWNGFTTFTSLHQSSFPAQSPNYNSLGALSGSFLTLDLVSITGPVGAKFAFYDAGASDPSWIYQIGTGFLGGTGSISLTETSWFEGSPEDGIPSDPYGHIHGRTFGADTSGTFVATWVLRDTYSSTTGMQDSTLFTTTYTAAAVPEPAMGMLLLVGAAALGWNRLRRTSRRTRNSAH